MKQERQVTFILAANDAVPLTSVKSYLYVRCEISPPFFHYEYEIGEHILVVAHGCSYKYF